MKKIIFALVVLMLASPAWAEVVITCANSVPDGNNVITVSYDATTEANLVRAIALEITLSGSGEFSDVNCLSKNFGYHIYLGDIDIDSEGTVQSWGSCKCDGAYPDTPDDANHMTIEAASLYEVGVDPEPDKSGDLVSFMVTGNDEVCVSIAENAIRGKVVMENADEVVDVNTEDTVCVQLPPADPYAGTCWSAIQCPGQSVGDATCDGNVNIMDVLKVKQSWGKSFGQVGFNQCADFDHGCAVNIMDILKVKQNWAASGLGGDNTTTPPATCP